MSYKFNPLGYDMLTCVNCGADVPLDSWDAEQARVQLADGAHEVPGLWVCKTCDKQHVSHVEQISAFVWLTGALIPSGMKVVMSAATEDTDLMTAISGLAIAQDVEAGNDLADALARELVGVPADPEPEDVADPAPADPRGAELAKMLDMRREADGSVSYACPNPVCPVGRHNFTEMADALPINVVAALVGNLPE